ncbi:unnamed protein product [Hapterophycus canaliculatus]
MKAPTRAENMDFRFASVEDAAEILGLVNDAFSVEKGNSTLSFTTRDRVSEEEVDACLQGGGGGGGGEKRWLVLETPRPEERVVAACLICTVTAISGTGGVEVLAVDPRRQGEGLGSQMLRRAEGILLNFRCRFVRMRVPQWREDVLGWAAKQGYKETGGGVWGELEEERAQDLTRPTRYFLLTRDLLTDGKVAGTFGDGTARFTAATAAAAERVAVTSDKKKPVSNSSSCEVAWGAVGGSAKVSEDEHESGRLAGFLSRVLKGLADAEGEDEEGKGAVAAPVADMAVSTAAAARSSPPVPPIATSNKTGHAAVGEVGEVRAERASPTGAPADVVGSSPFSPSDDDYEVTELLDVAGQGAITRTGVGGEESIETLLGSLMRALNTEKGRADFRLLAATGSTS